MFAIWVMQNIQTEPPYLLCHTSMFFALLRFQNGLDTVHNSPNKTNKINELANGIANLNNHCCFTFKITWKIRQIRQSNSPFSLHSTLLGWENFETWSLLKSRAAAQVRWGKLGRPGSPLEQAGMCAHASSQSRPQKQTTAFVCMRDRKCSICGHVT